MKIRTRDDGGLHRVLSVQVVRSGLDLLCRLSSKINSPFEVKFSFRTSSSFYLIPELWLPNGALGDPEASEKLHRDLLLGAGMRQMGEASCLLPPVL